MNKSPVIVTSRNGDQYLRVDLKSLHVDKARAIRAGATVVGDVAYLRATPQAVELVENAELKGSDVSTFLSLMRISPELGEYPGELYDHQYTGASFILSAPGRGAILGDEVGSGKTITSLHTMKVSGHAHKNVIVCLNSMVYTWEREVKKWLPGMPVFVVTGTKSHRDSAIKRFINEPLGTLIIGWGTLRHHPVLQTIKLDWAIADDCFMMKNYKALRTKAFLALRADRRMGLAGTLPDKPQELYPLLSLSNPVRYPATAKGYWKFVARVCHKRYVPWKRTPEYEGLKDPVAFAQETSTYILRRKKNEILNLPEILPAKNIYLPLAAEQREAYNDMRDDMIAEYDGRVIDAAVALTMMLRLLQISSSLVNVFDVDLSMKADAIIEIRKMRNDKLVILTPWRPVVDALVSRLVRHGYTPAVVFGGMKASDRQSAIDQFQHGDADTFIATDQVAGSGLTLTAANTLIWESVPWSRIRKPEGDARIHRISQTQQVQIINLVSKDTIEERVLDKQQAGDQMRNKMFTPLDIIREEFGDRLQYR